MASRYPLPPAYCHLGRGRAGQIRALYSERCSPDEIAAWLRVSVEEVRRTLLRPVQLPPPKPRVLRFPRNARDVSSRPRLANGAFARVAA